MQAGPIYLTTTKVLKEKGKTLDDINVLLAIFIGIAEEDFGPRLLPFHMERCRVGRRFRTLLI